MARQFDPGTMASKGYDWVRVESGHVKALCFEPTGQIECGIPAFEYGCLYVAFEGGNVYRYTGVSRSNYRAILTADSVGSALYNLVTIAQEGSIIWVRHVAPDHDNDGPECAPS